MIQKVKEVSVEEEYIECYGIYNIPLYEEERMIGRALVINPSDREGLVLLDIYVYHEEDRQKGFADRLMWYLTQRFDAIWTSWLSTAGRDLCLKHGFKMVKPLHKAGKPLLVYQKEEEDGGSKESGSKEEGRAEEGAGEDSGVGEGNCDRGAGEASGSPGSEDGQAPEEDSQGPEGPEEG